MQREGSKYGAVGSLQLPARAAWQQGSLCLQGQLLSGETTA